MDAPASPPPFGRVLPVLAGVTAAFFLNFLSRVILAPVLPAVERDLALDHAGSGSLFMSLSIGMSLMLICSGFVSSRLTHRATIVLATCGIGVFLLLAGLTTDPLGLRAAMFGLGLAAGLYLPSGIASITHAVHPTHWGRALSFHEMAPNLAFIFAPFYGEMVLETVGWRMGLCIAGGVAVIYGLIFSRIPAGRFPGQAPRLSVISSILVRPEFWILSAFFSLAVAGTYGVYAMLPLYLMDARGFTRPEANELLSLSRLSCPFMAFAVSWLIERLDVKRTVIIYAGLTGVLTIGLGLLSGGMLTLAVLLQAAFAVWFFPAGFTAVSRAFPADIRANAVGFIIPCSAILGNGAAPLLIGWLGDHGRFPLGFMLLGGLIVLAAATLLPRLSDKRAVPGDEP